MDARRAALLLREDRRFPVSASKEKRGRQVQSTAVGRALVQALPTVAPRPAMTALWEAGMRRIADGHMSLATFLDAVLKQIRPNSSA